MSWQRLFIYGLAGIVGAQMLAMGVVFAFNQSRMPGIGTFDAEAAINSFVLWSENKLDDAEFKALLAEFERQVDMEIAAFATTHDLLILRNDAVLSPAQHQVVDITEAVMREVLQ